MATKPQAKTSIDNVAANAKSDIDTILPAGVNIKSGFMVVEPGNNNYNIVLDAGGNAATALSWFTSIQTNLTTAVRPFTVMRTDRRLTDAVKEYTVFEAKLTVRIINF